MELGFKLKGQNGIRVQVQGFNNFKLKVLIWLS